MKYFYSFNITLMACFHDSRPLDGNFELRLKKPLLSSSVPVWACTIRTYKHPLCGRCNAASWEGNGEWSRRDWLELWRYKGPYCTVRNHISPWRVSARHEWPSFWTTKIDGDRMGMRAGWRELRTDDIEANPVFLQRTNKKRKHIPWWRKLRRQSERGTDVATDEVRKKISCCKANNPIYLKSPFWLMSSKKPLLLL